MIASGGLTEGHGRAILMADGRARRLRVAEAALADGLDRARDRGAGAAARRPGAAAPPRPEVGPVGDAALEAFGTAFDAPVRVRAAADGQMLVELRFPTRTPWRPRSGSCRPAPDPRPRRRRGGRADRRAPARAWR